MTEKTVEIVTGRERRRRWSVEEKLQMVAATYEPGACVKQMAASHDIYPGLLFTWRRQAREGDACGCHDAGVLAVHAAAASSMPAPVAAKQPLSRATGRIEVELKDGSRVRVDGAVSLALLRRVITALRG